MGFESLNCIAHCRDVKSFLDNEFSSFKLIQGKLYQVLIANLSRTKAPVTRMRFQIVPFSYPCVFK